MKPRWKEREKFLASMRQKPPVNLWMLIHSRSASWDCKRVNAAEAWTCERRRITHRTTTTRPAFQTQHCRWWWISHMYTHLLNHKHTHTVFAVAIRILSITVVKTYTYILTLILSGHNKKHAVICMHFLSTHLFTFHAHIYINTQKTQM